MERKINKRVLAEPLALASLFPAGSQAKVLSLPPPHPQDDVFIPSVALILGDAPASAGAGHECVWSSHLRFPTESTAPAQAAHIPLKGPAWPHTT